MMNVKEDPDFPDITPDEHRITRSNDLDLEFKGWLVGEDSCKVKKGDAVITVSVFYTVTKRIVASVEYKDFVRNHYTLSAEVCNTPEEALQWLKDGNGGKLGIVSKKAWEQACEEVPALQEWSTLKI